MPSNLIDDFTDASLWAALEPGLAPSAEIVLAEDTATHADVSDATSLRVEVSGAGADGHFISRSVGPLDLTDFGELRMWFRASVPADGSADRPFRLRVELGSAAMPVASPGNDWHRYLPSFRAGEWHFVRMALDDLDPLVRGGVDTIRMTSVNGAGAWTGWLDHLLACRPELIADVDEALESLLDGQLTIGGPVPARVHVSGAPQPDTPWLRLVHYDTSFSDVRTTAERPRTDFTDAGYRLGPQSVAYDLHYRVEAVTSQRSEHVRMIEFVLDVLGHRRTLLVNGMQLPLERVEALRRDAWADAPVLRYRIAARRQRGEPEPVVPVSEVAVETEIAP